MDRSSTSVSRAASAAASDGRTRLAEMHGGDARPHARSAVLKLQDEFPSLRATEIDAGNDAWTAARRSFNPGLRHAAFWIGAVVVGGVALAFAKLADGAGSMFTTMTAGRPWLPFLLAPAGLAISVLLTRTVFPGAQGSGIPQVIATLHMTRADRVDATLALRIGAGKVLLTLLGLLSGASIGREGPTVQVAATIMHGIGRLLRLRGRTPTGRWCLGAARRGSRRHSTRRWPAWCSPSKSSATRSRRAPPARCSRR